MTTYLEQASIDSSLYLLGNEGNDPSDMSTESEIGVGPLGHVYKLELLTKIQNHCSDRLKSFYRNSPTNSCLSLEEISNIGTTETIKGGRGCETCSISPRLNVPPTHLRDEDETSQAESQSGLSALTESTFVAEDIFFVVGSSSGGGGHGLIRPEDNLFSPDTVDTENDQKFNAERAKWLAYFNGLQMATRVEDNKDADRTYGPFILLALMFVMSMGNFLPLLAVEPTGGRKEEWNFNSDTFHVVLAISLGACIPVLIELLSVITEQVCVGEEPEGILYLTLSRFMFVVSHTINFGVIVILAISGGFEGRLPFYICLFNNYIATKAMVFVFFASVHLTHWPLWRYFALFSVFSVTIGMINYANVVISYTEIMARIVLPLVGLTVLSQSAFAYSVWGSIRRGKYRARNGTIAVPAVTVLMFQATIGALILLEIIVNAAVGKQRFVSYPVWVSCLAPIDRTVLIVLVAIAPIRLTKALVKNTRSYIKAALAELDPPSAQALE